jgi:hypothetical protein
MALQNAVKGAGDKRIVGLIDKCCKLEDAMYGMKEAAVESEARSFNSRREGNMPCNGGISEGTEISAKVI